MYDFSFLCRSSKADRNGLSPVELSIIINGKRTYVALGLKYSADKFKKMIVSKKNNEILEYTSNVRCKLNKIIGELMANDIAITAQSIKEYFVNGGVKSYTLSMMIADFIEYYSRKSNVNGTTTNVVRKYELALDKFTTYINKDIEVTAITTQMIEDFKIELKDKYQFEDTTIAHTLQKIKTAFTFAEKTGKLKLNPFFGITIGKPQKDVEKLSKDDIERIENKLMIGRLDKIKDLFLFQTYTGMAYADMANIIKSDIQFADGMYFIKKARQKTKVTFFSVLNEKAMNILKKYDYQLPILSNQKYNSYLKEIQDICNIKLTLHTHIARHTAATNMLNDGLPVEIVSKVLGHTNLRQTMHYAKLLDNTVLNAFRKIG